MTVAEEKLMSTHPTGECPRCKGTGDIPAPDPSGTAWRTCPTCHGRGWLNRQVEPRRP